MSMQGQNRRRFALVNQVAARIFIRRESSAEPSTDRRPSPAPESPERDQDGAPDLWKEPVPVMRDREGHLHLLL